MMPAIKKRASIRTSVAVRITWALVVVLFLLLGYNLYSGGPQPVAIPAETSTEESPDHVKEQHTEASPSILTAVEVTQAPAPDHSAESCRVEEKADYWADNVIHWGNDNIKESAEECCAQCQADPKCNVWVWCSGANGCDGGGHPKACWIKHEPNLNVLKPRANRHNKQEWVSGAKFTDVEYRAAKEREAAHERAEAERLRKMRDDPDRTLVYLDVAIKGERIGRMEFVLFTEESPLAAENFRALCTGEKGIAPQGHEGAGKPYHFKGAYFYRIIDEFIDQTGAGTDSIYGGVFKDDPGGLALKHDRKGLLSAANLGPDTNGSHFSIVVAPAPHLNGHYTIFGELVSGWEVAAKINALAKGKPDNTAGIEEQAQIIDSGQIRRGKISQNSAA